MDPITGVAMSITAFLGSARREGVEGPERRSLRPGVGPTNDYPCAPPIAITRAGDCGYRSCRQQEN